jgi:tetratricopeptide (TPR) repeat protein
LAVEEAEYLFRHALTQESAYESLLVKNRREIHRDVATAIERLEPERLNELAGLLAEHYSRAGDDAKTVEYSVRAAEAAVRLFALPEALGHFRRALEAMRRLPDTEELRRERVDVIWRYLISAWGIFPAAENLALAKEAEELASSLRNADGTSGDALRLARIHLTVAGAQIVQGEYVEALRSAQLVLDEAPRLANDRLEATAASQMGTVLVFQGYATKGEPYLQRAIGLLGEKPEMWEWFSSVGVLGMALAMRGEFEAGLEQVERVRVLADEMENGFAMAQSGTFLTVIYMEMGELPRVLEESKRTLDAADKSGHPVFAPLALGMRALVECQMGRGGEARETLRRAYEAKARVGGQLLFQDWLAAVGAEVALNGDRAQEALTLADEAIAVARSMDGIFAEGWARRTRARALVKLGRPQEEAEAELREVVRLFELGDVRVEAERTRGVWRGMIDN